MTAILLCMLVALSPTLSRAWQVQTTPANALNRLEHKTGWIVIGEVTADGKKWAAGGDPTGGFKTGIYEIVGSHWDRRAPRLPKPGERIRLTGPSRLVILDYSVSGEKRRLDSPAALRRGLEDRDFTGIRLEAGTVLEVKAAEIWTLPTRLRAIWARVEPVPGEQHLDLSHLSAQGETLKVTFSLASILLATHVVGAIERVTSPIRQQERRRAPTA